jgi:predicted Zn-dependent protease with MMP-like domain
MVPLLFLVIGLVSLTLDDGPHGIEKSVVLVVVLPDEVRDLDTKGVPELDVFEFRRLWGLVIGASVTRRVQDRTGQEPESFDADFVGGSDRNFHDRPQ